MGTTIRYAIAGTALYGLGNMIRQVSQLNQQLGQIQAISGIGIGAGSQGFTDPQMNRMLQQLMGTAMDTITPLNEVNDAAINFVSTVQNVQPGQLPMMLTQIGQGAKLAQTPVEDLTQAATTMQIAFNRAVNPTSIGQFTRMWEMLIGTAPGGISAAPTIAQAMPSLASMFQLAPGRGVAGNLGQAQMMALTLGVLRTGMPPATGMRGLTYLLQSIAQPTGGAKAALAGIGITPEFVQQHGIFQSVMRLLRTVTHTGNARQLGAIPDDALDQLDTSGGNLPGIPANEMSRLRTMIPRIHGIRAALILASQLRQRGDVSSIQQDLQNMLAAQDENSRQSKNLAKAWQDFRSRSRLAEAANNVKAMELSIAQAFEPVMGFAAQHVIDPVTRAARKHPRATRDIALGTGAFLAAMGVARFTGIGRGLPGIGRILGGAGNAFVRERAITAAMAGSGILGGSPQNPLYVTVVGQLFGGATPSPVPGGGGGGITGFFKRAAGWTGVSGLASKIGWGGAARFATEIGAAWETRKWMERHVSDPIFRHVGLASQIGPMRWSPTGRPYRQGLFENVGMSLSDVHKVILSQAQKVFGPNVTGVSGYSAGMWHGQADVNMTIDVNQDGKITRKRVHVPVDLWAKGRAPSHRGQSGKTVRSR